MIIIYLTLFLATMGSGPRECTDQIEPTLSVKGRVSSSFQKVWDIGTNIASSLKLLHSQDPNIGKRAAIYFVLSFIEARAMIKIDRFIYSMNKDLETVSKDFANKTLVKIYLGFIASTALRIMQYDYFCGVSQKIQSYLSKRATNALTLQYMKGRIQKFEEVDNDDSTKWSQKVDDAMSFPKRVIDPINLFVQTVMRLVIVFKTLPSKKLILLNFGSLLVQSRITMILSNLLTKESPETLENKSKRSNKAALLKDMAMILRAGCKEKMLGKFKNCLEEEEGENRGAGKWFKKMKSNVGEKIVTVVDKTFMIGVGLFCVSQFKMDYHELYKNYLTLEPVGFIIRDTFSKLKDLPSKTKEVHELLTTMEEARQSPASISSPILGNIRFSGVHWSVADKSILENINLEFSTGELIAIRGATGCGKSSLIKLLCRKENASEGIIFIDNIPITEFNPHHLWQSISFVDQECKLLAHDHSVRENIAIGAGDETYDDAAVREAASFVGLSESIELEDDVTKLSGGQRQLVVCARAVLKASKQGSKILILDEATSALDPDTTIRFLEGLKQFRDEQKCTVLFVTHNETVMKHCDKVCTIANKTVANFGNYKESKNDNHLLAQMFQDEHSFHNSNKKCWAEPDQYFLKMLGRA